MGRRREGASGSGGAAGVRGFGTTEVARLAGISPARVRALVRDGLCRPARHHQRFEFSFADLVLLRTAQALLQTGLPARRVRAALRAVAPALPRKPGAAALRLLRAGHEVVVRDGGRAWEPRSGQLVFPFEPAPAAAKGRPPRPLAVRPPAATGRRAEEWLDRALASEAVDRAEAIRCYRRALACAPEAVDAYVNLGRLLLEDGEVDEAGRLFREALRRAPEDATAHYNLALVLEDRGDLAGARRHYEAALRAEARFADAHYNLARLLERLGQRRDALRHLSAYKRLVDK